MNRVRRIRVAVTVGFLLILTHVVSAQERPAGPPLPSVALPAELDRVLRDYERLWKGRDPAGLAALFTSDGMALQSGRPPARGRTAIAEAYRSAGGELRLRALAFATDDSLGYIIGGYQYDAETEDVGKFVLVLRRRAQEPWLIAADIDNSNRRPGPPPGAPSQTEEEAAAEIEGVADSVVAAANARDADRFAAHFHAGPGLTYALNMRRIGSHDSLRQMLGDYLGRQEELTAAWTERRALMLSPDVAVFTGRLRVASRDGAGARREEDQLVTFTARRHPRGWRIVSWHASEQSGAP